MQSLDKAAAAEAIARNLEEALCKPYDLGEIEVSVRASIGIATFPADGDSIESLVKRADQRMYREKRRPRFVSSRT